ncbi:MAG: hypothetical protein KDJ35_07920 [Alphaproteobacteria bacterium]|nr:hypothetical protein [Alphaproteobacteria bacterium]
MLRKLGVVIGLLVFVGAVHAQAAEPRLMGTYGDWMAYIFSENGNKVCYMASKPKKDEGNYSQRGDIFALITHRPAEGTKDVFSYITGYSYKAGSEVNIEVNGKRFVLFTQDDTAWTPDSDTDSRLAEAIRAGSDMIVRGTSSRGTATKDTFGLKGSSAAYDKITSECRD